MSYVLDGFGRHRYQAPIVTVGLGVRVIYLPGGIVIGAVSNRYAVVVSAGRYPILASVAAIALEAHMSILRTLSSVRGLLTRTGHANRSSSAMSALRTESDVEEADSVE